jgi:hypothetical protein
MAFTHGKDAYFVWNSVNLSSYINDISFPQEVDLAETSTMGNTAKTFLAGLLDGSISIGGLFDSTADAALGGAIGTSAAFEFRANSGAVSATNPKYTGSAILQSYEPSASVGDAVQASAEFQISGAVTRATS